MFRNLGKIKYKIKENLTEIDSLSINSGINYLENFIIFKDKSGIKIYNRICDHNGGKLISNKGKTICPMHNWEFLPEKGIYRNGHIKKRMDYVKKKNKLYIKNKNFEPQIRKINHR